jgi:uncharacterized protein (TIGR03067 family)
MRVWNRRKLNVWQTSGLALLSLVVAGLNGCATERPERPMTILGEPLEGARREAITDSALRGIWVPKSAELGGKPFTFPPNFELRIEGARYSVGPAGDYIDRGRIELFGDELEGQARRLDTVGEVGPNKGKRISALYRTVGRELEVVYDLSGANRPTDFVSTPGTQILRVTYARKPPPT